MIHKAPQSTSKPPKSMEGWYRSFVDKRIFPAYNHVFTHTENPMPPVKPPPKPVPKPPADFARFARLGQPKGKPPAQRGKK